MSPTRCLRILALMAAPAVAVAAPADRDSPEAAVAGAYAVISGPKGAIDKPRFADVFTPTVRFVMVAHDKDGHPQVQSMGAEQFQQRFVQFMQGKPFYETGHTTYADVRGNVATLLSDYESRSAPGAVPFARGRNTFELVRGADGWRVDSIFWEEAQP